MIISASRRTDIPAFYADWLVNRIRAGYCAVPNPFNRRQVSHVSLHPEEVEVLVFWTRHPKPLFRYLDELNRRGIRFYFLYTVMGNPRCLEPRTPPLSASLRNFRALSDLIGPEKVIWRYDPIVFSDITETEFHVRTYQLIAEALRGYTFRTIISIVDLYAKMRTRLERLARQGIAVKEFTGSPKDDFDRMMFSFAETAEENALKIFSCAEDFDLRPYGIFPGKCIDDEYIERTFGIDVSHRKDPSQRPFCGCVVSKDIGMYDTCSFGCRYCYATTSFRLARAHYKKHDPTSPSLLAWYDAEPAAGPGPGDRSGRAPDHVP